MIPRESSMTVEDTLPGEEVRFSIDEEDQGWTMRVMAKLYSDPETAVIREYFTNGYDAHVEAGNTNPVLVTLPSMMNPFYIVQDFGTGMSAETLKNVYTKFGKSTGRNSNERNGMMGLGCKSAMAFVTSFAVESVHNGIKTSVSISRDKDWSIIMKVLPSIPTNEPSGTKVTIPVPSNKHAEFNTKAENFFKFVLPGRVLVNGYPHHHEVGDKITDNLYYSASWDKSYVVMNNVAYRINNPAALFQGKKISQINFVAYVDGGDVDFTPAREDLEYTDHTKATLHKIIDDFADKIVDEAKTDIAGATSHADAYKRWRRWTGMLGKSLFEDLSYKGEQMVEAFPIQGSRFEVSNWGNSTYYVHQWTVEQSPKTVFILDYMNQLSSAHKAKAREYAKIKGLDAKWFIFSSQKSLVSPWVDPARVVTWEDLKGAVPKKPRQNNNAVNPNAGRVKGSWDYHTILTTEYEKPLPAKGDIYFAPLREAKSKSIRAMMQRLGMDASAAVIIVPANRMAKFQRENPKVKNFLEYAKSQVVSDGPSLLSDDAKKAMSISRTLRNFISNMGTRVDSLDDKRFAEIRDLMATKSKLCQAYDDNLSLANVIGLRYTEIKQFESQIDNDGPMDDYPLLADLRYSRQYDEIVCYMNAAYAEKGI